jgi:hypothetical protein
LRTTDYHSDTPVLFLIITRQAYPCHIFSAAGFFRDASHNLPSNNPLFIGGIAIALFSHLSL